MVLVSEKVDDIVGEIEGDKLSVTVNAETVSDSDSVIDTDRETVGVGGGVTVAVSVCE
jgi:hypothetical protein